MGRHRRDLQTSSKSAKGKNKNKSSPVRSLNGRVGLEIRHGGNSIRIIQDRRVRRTCCSDPETQKGIGAVIFTLGIPSLIAGLIMTIVAATDDDNENKYPKAFIAVGPVLLVTAFVLFIVGVFLHNLTARKACLDCFSLENPDSFCRVRCPTLSQFISPDETVAINKSGMRALQTEPGKPVLKRNRLLSDPSWRGSSVDSNDNNVTPADGNDVFYAENETANSSSSSSNVATNRGRKNSKGGSRGVHFSDGDDEEIRRNRGSSITSDNGSVLSLKHCKIHPKNNDIWWTDEQSKNKSIEVSKEPNDNTSPMETTEL